MTSIVERRLPDPKQRDAALKLANRRRIAVADRRKEIAALPMEQGRKLLAQVLTDPTEDEASGRIGHWLMAPKFTGRAKVEPLLRQLRISHDRRLRDLTPRQVNIICLAVGNSYQPLLTDRYGQSMGGRYYP